ncbi:MAG: hypothetical protein GY930_08825 [bacterium]|nr:hypothetical protein [bacterium]
MKSNSKKTALQSFLAASAIIVWCAISAWAGSGENDFAASGDSVGTLPATAGGNNAVNPGSPGSNAGSSVASYGASVYLTLPQQALSQVVQSATGTGFVVFVPQGEGTVRAEFHGDLTLVLDENVLRDVNAEVGLVSDFGDSVLIGMELDGIPTRLVSVPSGVTTSLPVLLFMESSGMGVQALTIQSYQSPFFPSAVHITQGAGILVLTQGSL